VLGGGGPVDPLDAEEHAIRLASAALASPGLDAARSPSAAMRLTERAKARLAPGGRPVGLVALARELFSSNRGFGSEPLSHPLGFEELEQRIRAPHNGLRDVYVVDPRALGL
jgi:hypothetical protein